MAHTAGKRNAHWVLMGEPEGKRTLGIPRSRWEDNINVDRMKAGWEGVDCINLSQDWTNDSVL